MSTPTELCDTCSTSGLPILPVRYVPVPNTVKQTLPGWACGERVKDVPLGSEFHYALRTLRAGYVYLFYAKHARGPNRWECYAVTEDGCLLKAFDAMMAAPQPVPTAQCARQGHSNVRLHHLVIEQPDKCGPTWIAFSEHKWSEQTLKEYTVNSRLRNQRMQELQPAQMAKGAKHGHGTPASEPALQQVIEYASDFSTAWLPHGGTIAPFSKEDGSFDVGRLNRASTRYPWHQRQGQAGEAVRSMQLRATNTDGTSNTAHVLALWDAVGTAHELNGFRNDVAGWLQLFGQERELQISAAQAIAGLKLAIDKKVNDGWDDVATNLARRPDVVESGMRSQAVTRYAKGDPSELGTPLAQLDEKFRAAQIDEAAYKAERSRLIAAYSSNPRAMEAEYAKIDQRRRDLSNTRGTSLATVKNDDRARSWSKYEERLSMAELHAFEGHWRDLLKRADVVIDQRTQALIRWLQAPLFIDTLEDFHPACDRDSVLFEDAVGDAIFGMGSCTSGAQKIDQWIAQADATAKGNLIWRAIAFNQQEGAAEVNAALALVFGGQQALTTQAWDKVGSQVKWNKVFDLAKKSLTVFNTQAKAVNDASSGIRPVQAMRGLDKIFATVGGRWLRPITWTVDSVNEVTLRTLLLIRSGADPLPAKALGAWDAIHAASDRDMLVRRLKNQDFYLSAEAKAQYEAHAKKWAALREAAEIPDAKKQSFNAARDARLALVVAVFEAFNLYKASAKASKEPGNEKVQAQLTAARFATSAAAIDVLSNMVKGLAAAGDKAVSYQALKFGGGAMSVTASAYGTALDFAAEERARDGADYRMAMLYGIRALFQATSAALTVLTALSYCSPLIEAFGKRFGERLVGRALSWSVKRILLARAALIFASLEVSIFLLAVSAIIWYFEDDALQGWCDRCAFGLKRNSLKDAFSDASVQLQKYGDALKEAM